MKQNITYRILQRLKDGTIPSGYRETVKRWFVAGRDTEEKDVALFRIWEETGNDPDERIRLSLASVHHKINSSESPRQRNIFATHWLRYAAILLLPLITGLVVWQLANIHESNIEMVECYVPHGELRTVDLPDGTRVQMNSGTVFIYPREFSGKKRLVYLSGEANFTVTKNADKPFVVKTGPLQVEVLGTKFNVESYLGSGQIITTLESGAVKVYKEDASNRTLLLKPDEQLTYYCEKDSFSTALVDVADYSAWTHEELRFTNKPLNEILAVFERRYNVRFLVDQEIVCTDCYTMKFKSHETVEDVLHVFVQIVGGIDYKKEGQTIRLFAQRKEVIP